MGCRSLLWPIDEVFEGGQALRHPWTAIEQKARLSEWRIVDRDSPGAIFLKLRKRFPENVRPLRVTEKLQVGLGRSRKRGRAVLADAQRRLAARNGIKAGRIVRGQSHERNTVERGTGRDHPLGAQQAWHCFRPTTLFTAAGTRPEPAVSVPKVKLTKPAATATPDPELEPPEMKSGLNTLRQAP